MDVRTLGNGENRAKSNLKRAAAKRQCLRFCVGFVRSSLRHGAAESSSVQAEQRRDEADAGGDDVAQPISLVWTFVDVKL